MFINMLVFEWRYFVRQPSFVVTSLLFFLLPFTSVALEAVAINGGGNIAFNGASSIAQAILLFGFFSMFLVVNFVASTAIRNDAMQMSEILYTKPLRPFAYQLGRFTGAYLIVLTVSFMVPLGLFVGSLMPWIDPQRLTNFNAMAYIVPFAIFTIPTCFVLSAIFYALAVRFRGMMAVYLVALGVFVLYSASGAIFNEPNQRELLALSDPFGIRAFTDATRYWSPLQQNEDVVTLSANILLNRLIWIAVGIAILLGVGNIFSPLTLHATKEKGATSKSDSTALIDNNIRHKYMPSAGFSQFFTRVVFEMKQVFLSPAFIVLLAIAAVIIVKEFINPQGIYGTSNWPLTQYMVELIQGAFSLSIIIVVTFYSAEVVWRERSVGMGDIIDSTPVHNFIFWASKLFAVCLVILALLLVGMLSTLINQFVNGLDNLDLYQYVVSLLYFTALPQFMLVVLAFFIQALSPNKYIGMLIFVAYTFVVLAYNQIGLEHNMFNYAQSPSLQYSDMNGYGWYMQTQLYYMLYWAAFALVLSTFSYALWQRGPDTAIKGRLAFVSYGLGRRGQTAVVMGIVTFISIGTLIHYNTRVSNEFITSSDARDIRSEYEKAYAQYLDSPVAVTRKIDINVAIFTERRKLEVAAAITLQNNENVPVERMLVNYPRNSAVEIEGAQISQYSAHFKTAWMNFDTPLLPGDTTDISMRITRQHTGFKDNNEDVSLLKNGTFINNFELLPSFGVDKTRFLVNEHERGKHHLPPYKRAYALENTKHYTTSFLGKQASMIDFSATLSTSNDQLAIAPGYLQQYWIQGNRNYFRYEMNVPMINFYSIMSARFKVKNQPHNGVDIAVYYHKEHAFNVDRMIASSQDAIDLFSQVFGPYQYSQLRIAEFPGYRAFAQSFANTIPYSERTGFIVDLSNSSEIDPVYYITAHEVAHQWFGHQLNPANVQGSAVLTEGLSQYAALQLMTQQYGENKIRKFMTFELDSYLRGRANESISEMPLLRSEGQDYIHYNKAAIVMMAIADRVGFDTVNKAISDLLQAFPASKLTKATTLDLLRSIKRLARHKDHAFIDQQFTDITLYNIKLLEAKYDEDSRSVSLVVNAGRVVADGQGIETKAPFDDVVDIVVFSDNPNDFANDNAILYRQKHRLVDGDNSLVIALDKPMSQDIARYVVVDPFVRFIDKDSKDNVLKL